MVARQALVDRMRSATRVVVLRGPRGSGKATLVDQWLASDPHPGAMIVRVSVHPEAPGAEAVWAAVHERASAHPDLPASDGPHPGDAPGGSRSAALGALDRAGRPVVLVVEHAERVGPQLDRDLLDLVTSRDDVRLVVSTQSRGLLEVMGTVELGACVLGPADLAFTLAETQVLLGEAELAPNNRAAELHAELGGWVAPTAALARGGEQSAEAVRDFVRVVVEQTLSEGLQEIAAEIAVLPRVTPDLVEMLAAELDEPPAALGLLVEAGLCEIRQDGGAQVVHQPSGIRAALRGRAPGAGKRCPPAERRALARAARWYADHGEPEIAAETAWSAEDHELLAGILDDHWPRLLGRNVANAARWLSQLPVEDTDATFSVRFWRGLLVDFPTDPVGAAALAEDLGERVADRPLVEFVGESLTLLVALRSAHVPLEAVPVVEQQRLIVAQRADQWRVLDPDVRSLMHVQWGLVALLAADLPQALRDFDRGYRAGRRGENPFIARNAACNAAMVCALQADLAGAETWLARAQELPRAEGFASMFVEEWGPLAEALVASERCDLAGADAALGRYEPLGGAHPGWIFEAYVRAHVALCGSRPSEALVELEEIRRAQPEAGQPGTLPHALLSSAVVDLDLRLGRTAHAMQVLEAAGDSPLLGAARARVSLATGDLPDALVTAGAVDAVNGHGRFRDLDLLLVRAVAEARSQPGGGGQTFADAWSRVHRTGAQRALAVAPRADVLALARAGGLDALPPVVLSAPEVFPDHEVVLLTERERVVLAQLARTAAHREIAAALFVSVHTVKTQIRSLYRKLGASTREEALAAASRHGFPLDTADS